MMTSFPPEYAAVTTEKGRPPSWMVALLPPDVATPGVTEILARLEQSEFELLDRRMSDDKELPYAHWELEMTLTDPQGQRREARCWLQASEELSDSHLEWSHLSEAEQAAARTSEVSVGVAMRFGEAPLTDYHRQLQLLAALAPDATAYFDISAGWPRARDWLLSTAASHVPPAPENLYSVHAVEDSPRGGGVWLHTHGLLRCGVIELEILDAPAAGAATLCELLNATAAMALELGLPLPGEAFPVGHDLILVWEPWTEGLRHARRGAIGGPADRDPYHDHPSGLLFVPGPRRLFGLLGPRHGNPARYLPILQDNPLLFVSNLETDRMALLAREHLGRFRELWQQHRGQPDWEFLVKLGYRVDEAEGPEDREHLWFGVDNLGDQVVDATLKNEPYGIARMHDGQQDQHDLTRLSDWTILSPHGRFDPDSLSLLERALEDAGDDAGDDDGDTGDDAGDDDGDDDGADAVDPVGSPAD